MEKRIFFEAADGVRIEGMLFSGSDKGAVIAHPHPLYGGTMDNMVVQELARTYSEKGYTTLRFNFRGVGRSEGSYGNGNLEQQDIKGAIQYLKDSGIKHVDLAGYSFGAWVSAHLDDGDNPLRQLLMVSPPVGMMDFSGVRRLPRLKLAISGSLDQIAPQGQVKALVDRINPDARLEFIDGADHFFSYGLNQLNAAVDAVI